MPLDGRKALHLQSVLARTWVGRQRVMVFVTQSGGVYSYTTLNVLFRPQALIDFELLDSAGAVPRGRCDALLVAPITTSFVGVVYIADTAIATAIAVQAAKKYQVIEAVPSGMLPGGTRIHAYLRHLV